MNNGNKILDTYVFIDVSNIRAACYKSLGFRISFIKLYRYLKNKYPGLKDVRYYEGIARNDRDKEAVFEELSNIGYNVRSLKRRAYINPAIMKSFECRKCGHRNRVEIVPRETKMKSNVDVTVVATPFNHDWKKNSLSIRLKELKSDLMGQYHLNNINDIKDIIKL